MATIKDIREYTRELIMATLNKSEPKSIPESLTVSEIVEIALKGQMQYLIFNSLIKVSQGADEFIFIKKSLYNSTMKTFLQSVTAKEITNAFEKAGIRHQILKGAVTKTIYPSPEMREMSDIDLVVYGESLDNAAKIMEGMGFTNHGLIKHHMIFSKSNSIVVEVHWCLFDANAGKEQHIYFKDNFRAKLKDGTKYTYEFNLEDFYVYMIAHMAKHFFETGCGIRNLVDIYIYMGKYSKLMDVDYLKQELTKCGILDFENNMRELAFIWLDGKECNSFFENLFEYMVNSGIYGKTENGIWSQLAKETSNGSDHVKLHYFFPSINFMREKYSWLNKTPYLLPVAWVMRGFSGMFSKSARDHMEKFENADEQEVKKMLEIYHKLNLGFRR
ncbi:nucleotidyltransferase domain-containing protein [Butyrivibrio sp. WCE2006]|uniref:nucleotidyltransferase domain-containing protein n=1 Tax=Butyrivibrio sp. WCE2006 TaxID=1410611 RepID=UPI0005D1DEE3|nr:nucleotidyltransferase family protein [Butyrivibrio sp. WCE2006]